MESTKFFSNVQRLCVKKGISITALGQELGLSNATTAGWRKGSHPQSKTLKAVADYFGVSVDDLLDGTNIEQQNIQDNHGIIGQTYAPVTISNGNERALSEQEIALLDIFAKLSVMDRAKLLVYAEKLGLNSDTKIT